MAKEYPSGNINSPAGPIQVTLAGHYVRVYGDVTIDTYSYKIRIDLSYGTETLLGLPLRPYHVDIVKHTGGRGTQTVRETILKLAIDAATRAVRLNPTARDRARYIDWMDQTKRDRDNIQTYSKYVAEADARIQQSGAQPPAYEDFTWSSDNGWRN